MTRQRVYGSDVPFMAWLREQTDRLPSFSARTKTGIGVTDVDCQMHRYLHDVGDSVGTRDLQSIAQLEIKTRGGTLTKSQYDTYWKVHNLLARQEWIGDQYIWCWGVAVIQLSATRPDNSQIRWGRYNTTGHLVYRTISINVLFELLRFERHYDNLHRNPFRRHHSTKTFVVQEKRPLFDVERIVTKRS